MARSIMSGVWKEERREDRSVAITYSHNAGRLGRGRPVLECPPFLLLLLPVDSPCLSELACSCPLQLLQSPPLSLPHTHPLCLHTYTRTLAHPHENPATTTTTTTAATSRPAVPSGCAPARRPWCVATGCSCTCPSGEVVCSSTEAVIPLYPGPGH